MFSPSCFSSLISGLENMVFFSSNCPYNASLLSLFCPPKQFSSHLFIQCISLNSLNNIRLLQKTRSTVIYISHILYPIKSTEHLGGLQCQAPSRFLLPAFPKVSLHFSHSDRGWWLLYATDRTWHQENISPTPSYNSQAICSHHSQETSKIPKCHLKGIPGSQLCWPLL